MLSVGQSVYFTLNSNSELGVKELFEASIIIIVLCKKKAERFLLSSKAFLEKPITLHYFMLEISMLGTEISK